MKSILGFLALNVAQFGGAANDNLLKQILIFGMAAGGYLVIVVNFGTTNESGVVVVGLTS